MSETSTNTVMLILALSTGLWPFLLCAVFVFIYKYFPTRREIELMEKNQELRHLENKARSDAMDLKFETKFNRIEIDVREILQMKRRDWMEDHKAP